MYQFLLILNQFSQSYNKKFQGSGSFFQHSVVQIQGSYVTKQRPQSYLFKTLHAALNSIYVTAIDLLLEMT